MKISAVVNTFNEEKNIERCLASLAWTDEIVVSDASSADKTVELAKKFTNHVIVHNDQSGFVEPQRNAAIEQATGDWILIVDADEEIPGSLVERIKESIAVMHSLDYIEIPRKNIIFGKWIEHTGWWPDYQTRFFKKGSVTWKHAIHSQPDVMGHGQKLDPKEELAIVHHNYDFISQFIEKLNNYTTVQAKELQQQAYQFRWQDIIEKPFAEFLTRFFVWEGYKDGLHGLALSLLQAFSFFVVYLKVWQEQGFIEISSVEVINSVSTQSMRINKETNHWLKTISGKGRLQRLFKK